MAFTRDKTGIATLTVFFVLSAALTGLAAAAQERGQAATSADRTLLESLAGDYQAPAQIVQVRLRVDGVLTFAVPSQPVRELESLGRSRFAQKGLAGSSVEFVRDPTGKTVALISRQPNGTLFAARIAPVRGTPAGRGAAPPPPAQSAVPAAPPTAKPVPNTPPPQTASPKPSAVPPTPSAPAGTRPAAGQPSRRSPTSSRI